MEAAGKALSRGYTNALRIYHRHLLEFFGRDSTLADVTYDSVRQYEAWRRKAKIRGQSIREEVGCLKRAFKVARRRRMIVRELDEWPEIASDAPDVRRKARMVDPAALTAVLAKIGDEAREDMEFTTLTGLRREELPYVRASWLHKNHAGDWLILMPAEASKTNKERVIALSPVALAIFRKRAAAFGAEPLFPPHDHRKRVAKAKVAAGVEAHITPRNLRATFSSLARRKADPTAVRDSMGHEDYRMTNVYLDSDAAGLVAAAGAVEGALHAARRKRVQKRGYSGRRPKRGRKAKGPRK